MKTTITALFVLIGVGILIYFFANKKTNIALEESVLPSVSEITELRTETTVQGSGPSAENGDSLSVIYTGTLTNGQVFDASSLHGGSPFTFTLGAGQVIKGWEQGLLGMKKGEKRKLYIPADMAYGAAGIPDSPIGPNAPLVFEVELVALVKAE